MRFTKTAIPDVRVIDIETHADQRGFFARTMCVDEFAKEGLVDQFVQVNMSYSAHKGTLRGLHFQRAPYVEAKLIRCTRGAIWDVIVDLRGGSPTYLQHYGVELTAESRRQLYVPPGLAHSFVTLTDDVEVTYPLSAPYRPMAEDGVRYDDPLLNINWPIEVTSISQKDSAWPLLDREKPPF